MNDPVMERIRRADPVPRRSARPRWNGRGRSWACSRPAPGRRGRTGGAGAAWRWAPWGWPVPWPLAPWPSPG